MVAGVVSGAASGDDTPCSQQNLSFFEPCVSLTAGEKAIILRFIGLSFGALVGVIAGASKVKFPINGDFASFERQREKLKKYSIKKE